MQHYADRQTEEFLKSDADKVFVYGGYDDPNNFGDIIQLKGALDFYRRHYKKEPVILLSYRAFKDEAYVEKLTSWFDCRYYVFQHDGEPEQKWQALRRVKTVRPGGLLHVYGGGYINATWGHWHIKQLSALLDGFGVKDYVLSGHQIDEPILPELEKLFAKKMPLLVGLRDKESLRLVKSMRLPVPAQYSFDDVAEIFQAWTGSGAGLKARLTAPLRRRSFAVHMNMAPYTGDEQHREDIVVAIQQLRERKPNLAPVVLHSFNERRPEFTKDSLGCLVELQEEFPYHAYGVINLAQIALDIRAKDNYYPEVSDLLRPVELAVTCSYHTAMLMSFLGKPVYLIASNEYYRQKRRGLGYVENLDQFLSDPAGHVRDFSQDIEARSEWLTLLRRTVK